MATQDNQDLASQERGLCVLKSLVPSTSDTLYRGRFAPSPSGPLHFGSLIAAVASYCQAKANNGVWLVRMEDIDFPREMLGADKLIMDCLHAHGLDSDEPVVYQSQRTNVYDETINYLSQQGRIFYCSCTRKQLRARLEELNNDSLTTTVYPGTCRERIEQCENCSTRLKVDDEIVYFNDAVFGLQTQELAREVGDFVLQRRDRLYSYQLAVVIDDIAQGITEVVRGVDLIDSTQRQLYLYQCLGHPAPDYVHLPLALMDDGKKLSKQTGALALENEEASDNLVDVLAFLGQEPDADLRTQSPSEILTWAVLNWDLAKISRTSKMR